MPIKKLETTSTVITLVMFKTEAQSTIVQSLIDLHQSAAVLLHFVQKKQNGGRRHLGL